MTKRNLKFTFYLIITICLTLGLSISLQTLLAEWTPPSGSAPSDNVPPPIYASSTTGQLMDSDLGISGDLAVYQLNSTSDFLVGTDAFYVDESTGEVGIGTAVPIAKLDVAGSIKANNHVTHLPWYNIGANFTGYLKLSTPIVHNESNMFTIKIKGYEYGHNNNPVEVRCGGYAYSASTLIRTRCYTEGTDLPVEIGTETRADQGGNTVVVIRLGTPVYNSWYYSHFTAEYVGWTAKNPDDFKWVEAETTPAQTGNTNNAHIEDQSGVSFLNAGNVGIGTAGPGAKLDVVGNINLDTELRIDETSPQIRFEDTGQSTYWIHANSNRLYFLWDENLGGSWVSPYPLYFDGRNSVFDGGTMYVDAANNRVGIGITTPGAALDVVANSSTWGGWYEAIRFSQGSHSAITHPGGGLLFGLHSNRNFYWADTTNGWYAMTLSSVGNLSIRGNYSGPGCDIAERYEVSERDNHKLEPNDIVVMDSENELKIKKSTEPYSTMVVGVISTNPNMIMGTLEGNEDHPPVALLGRVPTKVTTENGPIKIGDNIVSSSKPGYGMRCEDYSQCQGAIVGKALQRLESGEGIIEVLIKGGL